MRKKGFTLVELLAVIAILAILVIVAMPNVLGMFNQAKVNSFVTEVQKIMDTATSSFANDALLNSGETIYYSSESNATLGTKELDMSGNKKNYFIEMDRNGEFKRVVVYDDNYCYDVFSRNTNGFIANREPYVLKQTNYFIVVYEIKKTSVVMNNIWESGNDSINITDEYHYEYYVKGCDANANIVNKNLKVVSMGHFGQYLYEEGMTWEDWVNSEYNVDGFKSLYNNIFMDKDVYLKKWPEMFHGVGDYILINPRTCNYYSSSDIIESSDVIEIRASDETCF